MPTPLLKLFAIIGLLAIMLTCYILGLSHGTVNVPGENKGEYIMKDFRAPQSEPVDI